MTSDMFGKFVAFALCTGMGSFVLWIGASTIKERFNCKEERRAKFLRMERITRGTHYEDKGEFEINYSGKKRKIRAIDDLSGRKGKQFKEGEFYTIYVNPKNPKVFRCTNRIVFPYEICYMLLGGFLFLGGLLLGGVELFKIICTHI